MPLHLRRRLTKWGNGFGIRITVKEAAALGLKTGQEVEADVHAATAVNDVTKLPSWTFGLGDHDLDKIAEDEAWEDERGRA